MKARLQHGISNMGKTAGTGKRRRVAKARAEADTGAKANAVEVRTAAKIGDNSKLKLPAPDTFDHHYKSIRGAQDKVKTAQALSSQASESANKASPGLAKVIKDTLKIENENDPIKLARHLEMMGMGLKQINSPIQLTVFDTLQGDVADQAYKRGFDDGENGRTANNAYPDGSDLATAYGDGWRHGTAKNLGITPKEADAALLQADQTEGMGADETQADEDDGDEDHQQIAAE
jgi:hypothetical protein